MRGRWLLLACLLMMVPAASAHHQAYWKDDGTAGGDPHFCMAWGMPPASVPNGVSGAECWVSYCIDTASPLVDAVVECAVDSEDMVDLLPWIPNWAYDRFVDDGAASAWNEGLGALLCHNVWSGTCGIQDPIGPYGGEGGGGGGGKFQMVCTFCRP